MRFPPDTINLSGSFVRRWARYSSPMEKLGTGSSKWVTSGADFSVEQQKDGRYAIRYALSAIKRVGFSAMETLVHLRGEKPFSGIVDFANRLDPHHLNRMQLENMAKDLNCAICVMNIYKLIGKTFDEDTKERAEKSSQNENVTPDKTDVTTDKTNVTPVKKNVTSKVKKSKKVSKK